MIKISLLFNLKTQTPFRNLREMHTTSLSIAEEETLFPVPLSRPVKPINAVALALNYAAHFYVKLMR